MVDREKAKWLLQHCVPVFKCKPCSIKVVNNTYVITETSTETLTKLQQHLSREHTTQYTDVQSNITECLQHYYFALLCQDCDLWIPGIRYKKFEDLLAVIEMHLRWVHEKTYESVHMNVNNIIDAPYCSNIRERYVYLKGSTFKCTLCFQAVRKEVRRSSWHPGGNLIQHLTEKHRDESSNMDVYTSKYHWFWDYIGIHIATDGTPTPKCLIDKNCNPFTRVKINSNTYHVILRHMTKKHEKKPPIMTAKNDLDEMSIESYINLWHPPARITVQENHTMDPSAKRAKLQSGVSDDLVADSSRDKPIHNVSKRGRLADQCGDRSVLSALQLGTTADPFKDRPVQSALHHGSTAKPRWDISVHSASQHGLTTEPCWDRSVHGASQHGLVAKPCWNKPVHSASQHGLTAQPCWDRSVHSVSQHGPTAESYSDSSVPSALQTYPTAEPCWDKPVRSASQHGHTAEPYSDSLVPSALQPYPTAEPCWDRPVHNASQHVLTAHLSNDDILRIVDEILDDFLTKH